MSKPALEDKMLAAFAVAAKAIESLDAEERRRVIRALVELYGVKGV